MKAVILCGGLATRMLPITKSVPKEMMPVLNKPIIHYMIETLAEQGVTSILIVTTRGKESIENYFDSNPEIEQRLLSTNKLEELEELKTITNLANIHFVRQITPRGTGHALLKAKSFIGEDDFLFMFGDELMYSSDMSVTKQLLNKYKSSNNNSVISVKTIDVKDSEKYGMIKLNNRGKLDEIVEKPKPKDAPSNICYLGNSILKADILNYIKVVDEGETNVVFAINDYAKSNDVEVQEIEGERFDVGNKLGLVKANLFYGLQDKSISDDIKAYIKEILG